jgi:hypothetical protein
MTAQAAPVNVTATGAVSGAACTYRGLSIGSTAGATVALYDNASAASGTVLASFTLAANGFQHIDIADGVRCSNGIYLSATAAVQGHVRVG